MTDRPPLPPLVRTLPTLAALGALSVVLAADARIGFAAGLGIGLAGLAFAALLSVVGGGRFRPIAPAPVLLFLGALAASAPLSALAEITAGAAGVAVLAWIANDPFRPPWGALRGALGWGVPGLAVGLAWVSSFLLPPSAAPVGVAGALLAATVIAIAVLFAEPERATGGPASTS